MGYKYYPRLDDKNFYEEIYTKKEFYKNRYTKEYLERKTKPNEFNLTPSQLFLRNFISPDTPYNGILIFHGTGSGKSCAAVQIAENFKDFMKSIHTDEKRKILVILGARIRDNFKKTIYDINKESLKKRPDDIVQCTGNTYSKDIEQYKAFTLVQKLRLINRDINHNYNFFGYEEFGNEVLNLLKDWNGKLNDLTDAHKRSLKTNFKNRLIIIDEIHNIKSESATVELRKVPPILEAVIRYGENIKLVLMSATPMYDNAAEFIYILNLLLLNDRRETIKKEDILDQDDNLKPGADILLKELTKGYISYLRGYNPKFFPVKLFPPNAYTPNIIYDIKGNKIPPNERLQHFKLTNVHMSKYQYEQYIRKLREKPKRNNNINEEEEENLNNTRLEDTTYADLQPLFYISNIILPNKNMENVIAKKDGGAYQKFDNGLGPFILREKTDQKTSRKYYEFQFQNHVKFNLGTKNEKPFIDQDYLHEFSTKYSNALNAIRFGKGICYVYSEFVWGGVVPFALMLEQNGFRRYTVGDERQLLDYPKNREGGGGKRDFICAICGENRDFREHKETSKNYHKFVVASYILMTGGSVLTRIEPIQLTDIVNNINNMNGEEVKIILGTQTTGEGLDFERIRQIHVIEPWYNMARMDQIVGRGVRFKSHNKLPPEDRNVEIFFYNTMPPSNKSKKDLETETIDSRFYRKAEIKDRKIKAIEHILKISSVDCSLNLLANDFSNSEKIKQISSTGNKVLAKIGDIPFSRECDYLSSCGIKCVWEPEKKKYKINTDTYNERLARNDIEGAKRVIKNMYVDNYIYTLEDLVKNVKKKYQDMENEFIYIGIQELIDNVNEPLYDRYDRKGKMIYKGRYYIYQPLEFNYEPVPLYYKKQIIDEKPENYSLEYKDLEFEEEQIIDNKKLTTRELFLKFTEDITKILEIIKDDYKKKYEICVGLVFDELNNKDKRNLLRYLILQYYSFNKKLTNEILNALIDYTEEILLYKYRDLELKKSDKDTIIGYMIGNDYYCYDEKTGQVISCSKETKERIKLHLQLRKKKEEKFNRLYGYMQKWKHGNFLFKIFDLSKETGAKTMENKPSKRSEIKGKVCETFSAGDLKDIVKRLGIKTEEKNKNILCTMINYNLRKNDMMRKDGRRWFLNALEL